MSALPRRFQAIITRLGDAFTVGGASGKGVFAVLPAPAMGTYLTDAEIGAATRPVWLATVAYDDATNASDTLTWNGAAYTVVRVVQARFRGETVARVLVLA